MKPMTGWANAPAMTNDGKETIPAGGHGCVIRDAKVVEVSYAGVLEEKLALEFDIKEGTSLDGYYARQYEKRMSFNAGTAKWGGVIMQSTHTKDGAINPYFKGLINSVEKSNPGYSFEGTNFNEATLAGKRIGFVFRDEPFTATSTGEVVHYMRAAWSCGYDEAKDQPAPSPKPIRGQSNNASPAPAAMQEYSDEELPF